MERERERETIDMNDRVLASWLATIRSDVTVCVCVFDADFATFNLQNLPRSFNNSKTMIIVKNTTISHSLTVYSFLMLCESSKKIWWMIIRTILPNDQSSNLFSHLIFRATSDVSIRPLDFIICTSCV